jgi:peptide/nickel transport system substrate-binding protein
VESDHRAHRRSLGQIAGRPRGRWLHGQPGIWLLVLALLIAGCNGGTKQATSTTSTTAPPVQSVRQGGDIVVAAEQEPTCMDWVDVCGNSRWGIYTVEATTMPRAYDVGPEGSYVPSILLTGEAAVVAGPPTVITYNINPRAAWDDGTPITSADFRYTWQQITASPQSTDTMGYNRITTVDDSDPHRAVVTFLKPFGGWKTLFGGTYGILPSHLLLAANRSQAMKNGYPFSGGPWKLDHWSKGVEIKLVPNARYWGKRPDLSSITFRFPSDATAEAQQLTTGQIVAAYPGPQTGQLALNPQPGVVVDTAASGLSIEALWFNVLKSPLDSKAVRQALAYATDRDTLVEQVYGAIQPGIRPVQSFYAPVYGKAYSTPFARYTVNQKMVDQLMTGDGWTRDVDGIWSKGAIKASLELKTTATDPRRLLTAQLIQAEWEQAGFKLTVTTEPEDTLLHQDLPSGNFEAALYAHAPSDADLAQCALWCTSNIPTVTASRGSQNYDRIVDANLDHIWQDADNNLDADARVQDAIQGQAALADLVPALPIVVVPDVLLVKTATLAQEGGNFQHNFVFGPFIYANKWYLR